MNDAPDLKERVGTALRSPKVDAYMLGQYHALLAEHPDVDLTKTTVYFLARMTGERVDVPGVMGRTGNIYSMGVSYSSIPELIGNKDVISLEASRPAAPD